MRYHCSHCHATIDTEGNAEPEHCPNCKAEIGFEPVSSLPTSVKLFGWLLASAIATATLGGIVARVAG